MARTPQEHQWLVISGGVTIPAPLGVYDLIGQDAGAVVLLVCYGDPLQTKAIGARLATNADLSLVGPDGETVKLVRPTAMRMRGAGLSGGGHRLIVWDERAPEEMALWFREAERPAAVQRAIDARRIPYDPAWLAEMERWLLAADMLLPLTGWGGAGGYALAIDEDRLCDWLIGRFGRQQPIHQVTRAGSRRAHAEPAAVAAG